MYNKFFGFKENPFKLVPNPAYLFLSKSHEEAMAHLTYAIDEGDGFAKITGEIGTGKTTLCRAFIENLDESVEVAYIFNPRLNSIQLLKTINTEFGILSSPDNAKDLIDALNAFLISKKSKGKKVLLLIDEAQNLSMKVLEQIRLISNLETKQSKLLQIILVGQLELDYMLNSPNLRQLKQRINLSCEIVPLTYEETKKYIQYRVNIATNRADSIFSKKAIRRIYKYSKGIPRLINISCDRMLLRAYTVRRHQVSGKIAKDSVRELRNEDNRRAYPLLGWKIPALLLSVLIAIFITIRIFETSGTSTVVKNGPLQPQKSRFSIVSPPSTSTQEPNSIQEIDTLKSEDIENVAESEEVHTNMTPSYSQMQNRSDEKTFSIQVGAFLLEQNAKKRKTYLENKGYAPRVIPLTDSRKRVWYTVRIGSYDNQEEASRFAKEFSSKVKFKVSVRRNDTI